MFAKKLLTKRCHFLWKVVMINKLVFITHILWVNWPWWSCHTKRRKWDPAVLACRSLECSEGTDFLVQNSSTSKLCEKSKWIESFWLKESVSLRDEIGAGNGEPGGRNGEEGESGGFVFVHFQLFPGKQIALILRPCLVPEATNLAMIPTRHCQPFYQTEMGLPVLFQVFTVSAKNFRKL